MKKFLNMILLLILLPAGMLQAAEFKIIGRTSWQLGQLMVNGIPFALDKQARFEDGLTPDDLGDAWVELEGVAQDNRLIIKEVEAVEALDELELAGPVRQGRIWGYGVTDFSLAPFEGLWLELECHFDGQRLSQCREDD